MNETFLGIFLGLIVSSVLGVFSLFWYNSWANFSLRKSLIISLKQEIINNIYQSIEFTNYLNSNYFKDAKSIIDIGVFQQDYYIFDNFIYKSYFKELFLLKNKKLINHILNFYNTENNITLLKNLLLNNSNDLFKTLKYFELESKDIVRRLDEITFKSPDSIIKELDYIKKVHDYIKKESEKLTNGIQDTVNNLFKKSKDILSKLISLLEEYKNIGEIIKNSLELIENQNYWKFLFQKYRN